ncbi:MAG: hypothetical protein U0174_22070 [Polyangiaceae bacterium]
MTPDQYFFLDEEQQKPIAVECAQRLIPVIGGQMKWRDEGDALHITGYFNGRPARMIISVSFGSVTLELKMNPIELENSFYIQVDPDAKQHAGESMTRDEWDDDDGTEQKLFLGPHVFFSGEPEELSWANGMLRRISQEGQGALLQTLGSFNRGHFMANRDLLSLDCPASITLAPNSGQMVAYYLNLLFMLSNEMDKVWRN